MRALWIGALFIACSGTPVARAPQATPGAVTLVALPPVTAPSAGAPAVPFSLTASDGSGLVLARVDAHAVVEGPLAFTELHLYFANPEPRVREGTFQITLPSGAGVARFAMESDGAWLEAEVVPKQLARRAYDDFLHRRTDPALLERAPGNQFTAKVFPIPAAGTKHLVVSYSAPLVGARYTLPLRGLPRAGEVRVEVALTGADGARAVEGLHERDWTPDRDFVARSSIAAAAATAGPLVAMQVPVAASAVPDVPRGLALLVDTSASRGLGFEAYVARIGALVAALRAAYGDALPLGVAAFDQTVQPIFAGRAADFGDAQLQQLRARGAAGASDVGGALAALAATPGLAQPRVVLVGDGVITAGDEGSALQARIAALGGQGVERLDVVLAGGLRDEAVATQLVRGGLARPGAVLDLERDAVAAALGERVLTNLGVSVAGASWVAPRTIASARAGSHVLVLARLAASPAPLEVTIGGERHALQPLAGSAPLLERMVVAAELDELEAQLAAVDGATATALRATIAQRSVAHRVLSRETAFLVLETTADYARYGIARGSLADVLVVTPRGVEQSRRTDLPPLPAASAQRPPPPEESDRPGEAPAPAGDRDRDSIPDSDDACPTDAESMNGLDDADGCPDRGRVVVTDTAIMVLDMIYFEANRAVIKPQSYPILDAVAATLQETPDITLLEIQGHTDERGDDRRNLDLSDRRAVAVRRYLIGKGIARRRLSAMGYGESQPVDRRHTELAWAKNRRVAFLILERGGRKIQTPPAQQNQSVVPADEPPPPLPVIGELAAVRAALAAKQLGAAETTARAWLAREPGHVLGLLALAEVHVARGDAVAAARTLGSIIDLYPGRADLRRFAAARLAVFPAARPLVLDSLRRAVADRPDHMTGHRLLAYELVRAGQLADAFAAITAGRAQAYRYGDEPARLRVLDDDVAMIGAAYIAADPAQRAPVTAKLATWKLAPATARSTRFCTTWETDSNDVDFHILDGRGNEADFRTPVLPTGGELYADVTDGYGPECFVIAGAPKAAPYRFWLHYYAQGPMGFGMGTLQIQTFDPATGFTFDDRPYVIMTDGANVELGTYAPKKSP